MYAQNIHQIRAKVITFLYKNLHSLTTILNLYLPKTRFQLVFTYLFHKKNYDKTVKLYFNQHCLQTYIQSGKFILKIDLQTFLLYYFILNVTLVSHEIVWLSNVQITGCFRSLKPIDDYPIRRRVEIPTVNKFSPMMSGRFNSAIHSEFKNVRKSKNVRR